MPSVTHKAADRRPLCVDLDGTLLATDSLWESLILLLKAKPGTALLFPLWLMKGKAFFKHEVARRVALNPASLPYRDEVLSFLKTEMDSRRELILATASDRLIAENIANHIGMFSTVLSSDGTINLSGQAKLEAIIEHVGDSGFDYIGNSAVDLPIWRGAHQAILVQPSARLRKQARSLSPEFRVLGSRTNPLRHVIRALRVHQWVKNLLLFVPLALSHKVMEPGLLLQTTLAFVAFSLCASGIYIVNDLLDLEADRQHPTKRYRPFAAGSLQLTTGVFLAPLLIGGAFALASVSLPRAFIALLGLYLVVTIAYSFYLKQVLIVDVLVLAGLYTLRVLAGGVAVDVWISPWLLVFSMFIFLSLAFLKRYSELRTMQVHNREAYYSERKYHLGDVDLLGSIGPSNGYISVLVFALYINSQEVVVLYQHPEFLWLIGPCLLYWLTRLWFVASRGNMTDDPIVFAVKDPASYVVGVVVLAVLALASS